MAVKLGTEKSATGRLCEYCPMSAFGAKRTFQVLVGPRLLAARSLPLGAVSGGAFHTVAGDAAGINLVAAREGNMFAVHLGIADGRGAGGWAAT